MMLTTLSVANTITFEGVLLFLIAFSAIILTAPLRRKTKSKMLLLTFFVCMALMGFSRILEGTVGGLLFIQLQDTFIILGGLFLVQFAYHFPAYDQPREARIVLGVYILITLLALGTILVVGIDSYRNPETIITSPEYFWYLMPLAIVLAVGLCLRRSLYYAGPSKEGEASWGARLVYALRAILNPPNNQAGSQRNLALAISVGAIQALASTPLVKGTWAVYMIGIGGLLVVAGIALVYYSHTLEPISFVARLVGISLTALLIFAGISGFNSIETARVPREESLTRQFQAAKEAIVRNTELANASASDVSYIVSWPAPTDHQLANLDIHYLGEDVQPDDLISIQGLGGSVDDLWRNDLWRGTYFRFAGVQFRDFYRFRFGHDGRVYEVGFSWLEYARPILREVNSHILLTIAGTLFILILFPLFFRRHLFRPLNNLLQGVKKVDKGRLELSLPIFYEDEIGSITRSFNRMTVSLRQSNSRRDQYYAESIKANEELLTEIAERQAAEATARRHMDTEQRLAGIANRLLTEPDMEQALQLVLQDLGQMIAVDRIGLVRFSTLRQELATVYGWRRPGLEPLTEVVHQELGSKLAPLIDRLRAGDTIFTEDAAQLGFGAGEAEDFFTEHGIHSFLAAPIQVRGQLLGVLVCTGFAQKQADKQELVRIMGVVAGLLSGLLQRESLLENLDQRIADRTAELSAFLELIRLSSEKSSLYDLLGTAVTRVADVCRCDAVAIHLMNEDSPSLWLVAHHGLADYEAQMADLGDQGALDGLLDPAHNPIVMAMRAGSPALPPQLRPNGFQVYLGAQLRAGNRVTGLLSCYRRSDRHFSLDRSSLLVALAEQLAITVENHRLRQQSESLAIVAERQRLARDLHDSVSQSLYGLTLLARSGYEAAQTGDKTRLTTSLANLEEDAFHALREMRLLLYQLRPPALEQKGLGPALAIRLSTVEKRAGIAVAYSGNDEVKLPADIEKELYHVAIEALNNATRHAEATGVTVRLESRTDQVQLEIIDDGCGFDPDRVSGGLGLKNMRERAERLGGELRVVSAPGIGTKVAIVVDL